MRISYQKEILREFEKLERARHLKEEEEEILKKGIEVVYPNIVNSEGLLENVTK